VANAAVESRAAGDLASACEETKSGCNCESSKTNQGQQVSLPNCALDEVSCLLKKHKQMYY